MIGSFDVLIIKDNLYKYNKMFQHKPPKSEVPDKGPYNFYSPHSRNRTSNDWKQNEYIIISIDPGIKNYAIRVESRERIDPDTKDEKVGTIKPLLYELLHPVMTKNDPIEKAINNLTLFLNNHVELFKKCHMVIIERQMHMNYKSSRIMQHTITYFMVHLKDAIRLPLIIELDSKLKGRQLGAPSGITEGELKKWATREAMDLLYRRKDWVSYAKIQNEKKKDDLSDTVMQIEALFDLWELPVTPKPLVLKVDNSISTNIKLGQPVSRLTNNKPNFVIHPQKI